MSDEPFTPKPPPDGLRAGGRALWVGIAGSFDLMPEQLVQLEEACRAKDRLDKLDALLSGDVDTWAYIDTEGVSSLRIDAALAQANTTANLMKQLLAALRLPDEEGRRPQFRGARGAQAPSVPGGAAEQKGKSASDRAKSRWGA